MISRSVRLTLGASLVAATLAVAGCAPAADDGGDRAIMIAVDPIMLFGSWDPAQVGGAFDGGYYIAQAAMSPLFSWEPDGDAIPALAEGYVVADDRRSIDIALREGVEFADGSPVDADAVVASFGYFLSEESGYPFKATALDVGTEFSAVDDHTVRLTFSEPVFHPGYFTYDVVRLLLFTPVLSPSGVADPAAAAAGPMSVGPYLLEEYVPEVEATFVRNPDYWDPESFPYDTVVLKAYADPVAKLNALKSGQVDAAKLTPEQVAEAEGSGFRIQHGSPSYFTLAFRDPENGTSEPLRDVRVRQAMALAFDRESIAEEIDLGYGRVSSQALVAGQPGYIEGGDERYGFDLERARELMAEAGYAEGFDVVIPAFSAESASVLPIVEQSLGDIGIRVTYEPVADGTAYFTALTSGDYPVALYLEYNVNTIRVLDEEFTGFGRYFDHNDDLDRILTLYRQGDDEERATASQELGEKLLDEVWYIPISRPPFFWGTAPGHAVDTDDTFGGGAWLSDFHPVEE